MRELDVANSELETSPGGREDAGVWEMGGIVIPSTAPANRSLYSLGEAAVSSCVLDGVGSCEDDEDSVRA